MEPELSINMVTTVSREFDVLLPLEGQRVHRVNDYLRQSRGVQDALVKVEIPRTTLLCEETALQTIGEFRGGVLKRQQLLVEQLAQAQKLLRFA